MNGLISTTTTLDPERLKAELAAITDPAEIRTAIDQYDAWTMALREVGTDTDALIDAVYKAVESRCRAVEIHDGLDKAPGRPAKNSSSQLDEFTPKQRTLRDLKTNYQTMAQWRLFYDLGKERRWQLYIDAKSRLVERFAVQTFITEGRQVARMARNEELNGGRPLVGQYGLIYADPPWRYEHSKADNRVIENHYPTMDLGAICLLPVSEIAADDSVLFLWTTSPKLAESMQVLEAWGFVYRTCLIWDKETIGMGYYARQQHELLLIAIRGEPGVPDTADRPPSVIRIRRKDHSAKPVEFYGLIERMYPYAAKIELFARSPRPGWDAWGNQIAEAES